LTITIGIVIGSTIGIESIGEVISDKSDGVISGSEFVSATPATSFAGVITMVEAAFSSRRRPSLWQ